LVVTVSSPAAGSTVSGTIPVTASVTIIGSVVVAGVQFQLDGATLGAEDATAPYSISWNTTTASNGSHTLTAVARDALGLRYTSNPVTVTVFNDTTAPTVSITAPTAGSTVGGATTVSASASDNVGVVGVQFKLDGANLGAEDTTAPYSVSWDSTAASEGWHTLTAIARDAGRFQYSSGPVQVTVSNVAPPIVPIQRFEETDASVSFSAGWSQSNPNWFAWSGGGAAESYVPGAQATFSFIGTSVTWIGMRGGFGGIARVLVDGVVMADVDLFARTDEIHVPVFKAAGLTNSSHQLTIQVTGRKNSEAVFNAVWVDAFDVPAPAVSQLQETDPSITYGTGWSAGDNSKSWSGGFAAVATTPGAQATLTFNGTAIRWNGYLGPDGGIARVYLDGVFAGDVDTYSATHRVQGTAFAATGLADAVHTLTIEATGLKNAASTGTFVVIDSFEVTAPGMRFEETDWSVTLAGDWIQGNRNRTWSNTTAAESATPGAQATITFVGTSVRWIGLRGRNVGIARVYLDGVFVTEVDTYAPTEGPQNTVYAVTGLANATHRLTIEATGRKNPAANNAWIVVDAFDVR